MVVRSQQPQMAGLCAMAAGCILLLSALDGMEVVQDYLRRMTALGGIREDYLNTLLKVLGMSYLTELAMQACADLGENGLALKVSLMGKLCVFAITAPMLLSLLEMILELVP